MKFRKLVAIEPLNLTPWGERELHDYADAVVLFRDVPQSNEEIIRRIRAREDSLRDRSSAPYHRSLRLLRAHPSASAKEFGEALETLKKMGKD